MKRARKSPPPPKYVFRLYVSGPTRASIRALINLASVCEENLAGRYDLQVIDVHGKPDLAASDQIVATPTLLKELPPPVRRLIGDLSERDRVILGLGIRKEG